MTNEELLKGVEQAEPELFQKIATTMALTERLEPEFVQETATDINDILDFAQEKIAEYDELVKTAAKGTALRGVGSFVKDVGMGVGAGIGAALLTSISSDIYDAAKRGLTKGSNLRAILRQNPELADKFKDNRAVMMNSYNTLHRFAPEFTADPSLGGQLLNAMADSAEAGGQSVMIKDLLNSRKTILDSKKLQFQPRFGFTSGSGSEATDKVQGTKATKRREVSVG
jgi:hypothetical protein